MADDYEFFKKIAESKRFRPSARGIILSSTGDQVLLEKNHWAREGYLNFIGGGVEWGETLKACLRREICEETGLEISQMNYLFVVENFVTIYGLTSHGIEHYFEVELDQQEIQSTVDGLEYVWEPIQTLDQLDLRPAIVRDRIVDGTFRNVRHLISLDQKS